MQNVTESEYKFTIYEKVVVPPVEWNAEMLRYLVHHFQVLHFQVTYCQCPCIFFWLFLLVLIFFSQY